jgi:hypothetical protein
MSRTLLFPVLLLSGLAFAADPAPAPTGTTPTTKTPTTGTTGTTGTTTGTTGTTTGTTGATTGTTPATGAAAPVIPKAVFKDLDKNSDKVLDKAELATLADLVRDYDKVDTDKNGKLNEAEYNAWANKPAITLAVFKDIDKNNDKALDKAELANLVDLVRDFSMVDTDKNGKLNEAEYNAWKGKQTQM